jgi:hypothetical protein
MNKIITWKGSQPSRCELNGETIKDKFVDGVLKDGRWAILCPNCHKKFGVGLGVGRGQLYERRETDGVWIKTQG